MARCLIALGANLGDRKQTLDGVVERLGQVPGLRVVARSRWHETLPVGGPSGQGPFLNGALLVETSLPPEGLLAVVKQLETEGGRRRETRWGPRPLDLDILLYDQLMLETPTLTIPHPRMAWRRFVLEPAVEVGGAMVHPTTGWTVARLLSHLNQALPYVAVTGLPGVGKTLLAGRLAQVTGARLIAWAASGLDSSSIAWDRELEFLEARTRLLAAERLRWKAEGLGVSDFWLGQALAYAAVHLPSERQEAFRRKWDEAHAHVVAPKLTVLVDSSPTEEWLAQLRRALLAALGQADQGPVLRLSDATSEQALAEIQAAVEAMK